MNTTIIRTDNKTARKVLDIIVSRVSKPIAPVVMFGNGDGTFVISGCSTQHALYYLERYAKKMQIVKCSK